MSSFNLTEYLEQKRTLVDTVLEQELPPETERPDVLHRALRHAVFPGGKRLRPVLCMAAAETVGGSADDALLAAAAVELLHSYTLVHDDLPCMDDDSERRGKPTVHVAFGEANAVLAGDALQALAFELAARSPAPPPWTPNQLVIELAAAAGSRGVVGGQVEDIASSGTGDADIVAYVHEHKTADLFRAAVRMGAIAAGASSGHATDLARYAMNLGLAFQITDDVLDTGHGDGLPELSCIPVYGEEGARRRAADHVLEAVAALSQFPVDLARPLIAIVEAVAVRVE